MSLRIPLADVPSQVVAVTLAQQPCVIRVYTLTTGLFFDLAVNGVAVVLSVLCQDRTYLIREEYVGFSGNFFFADTQGTSDPTHDSLSQRFALVYQP